MTYRPGEAGTVTQRVEVSRDRGRSWSLGYAFLYRPDAAHAVNP